MLVEIPVLIDKGCPRAKKSKTPAVQSTGKEGRGKPFFVFNLILILKIQNNDYNNKYRCLSSRTFWGKNYPPLFQKSNKNLLMSLGASINVGPVTLHPDPLHSLPCGQPYIWSYSDTYEHIFRWMWFSL